MNKEKNQSTKEYIEELIQRAREAQKIAESFTQERVDELVTAIVWNVVKDGPAQEISNLAVEESRLGDFEGKYKKLLAKSKGALRDMLGKKSVGIIDRDEEWGIIKVAKPVGVVGALCPCTNPEATPVTKAIAAIKGRNAIIFSPHPRTKKTNTFIVNNMRKTLEKYGAPKDLLIPIEEASIEKTNELMKQCDLVMATGGGGMVKAAYSSGTPAYGVGQGNAVVVVDETADIKDAANKVMRSKTFDHATSCSAENALIIQDSVYDEFVEALITEGGYLIGDKEKAKLQKAMWVDGHLSRKIVAQPIQKIADEANITVLQDKKFIMVEEIGIGADYPFSGEKLSMVVALFKYDKFEEAIDKVNKITAYHGTGHSCGIHSFDEKHITDLYMKTKTSRVMVRQPQCLANTGAWTNGMPFTTSLGCGTWGGNIASENVTWKHLINTTWVSYEIPSKEPTDEELFGKIMLED